MPKLPRKLMPQQQLREAAKAHPHLQGPVADLLADTATGSWRLERPVITQDCRNCGICAKYCPCGVITKGQDIHQIEYTWCKGCGICATACPFQAIEIRPEKEGEA